jgi:hypothetical protein
MYGWTFHASRIPPFQNKYIMLENGQILTIFFIGTSLLSIKRRSHRGATSCFYLGPHSAWRFFNVLQLVGVILIKFHLYLKKNVAPKFYRSSWKVTKTWRNRNFMLGVLSIISITYNMGNITTPQTKFNASKLIIKLIMRGTHHPIDEL